MGVLVDIVPNHVGVATPSEDPWWWDVLRLGRASEHASAFDVDWAAGDGRILIPVIGDDDEDAIRVVRPGTDKGEVRYHDQRFPLAPGTSTLEEQHYELVSWRAADDDLNYRRFFAVNTLAAVRVEDPEVFAQTHVEVKRWFDEGLVDGLRSTTPTACATRSATSTTSPRSPAGRTSWSRRSSSPASACRPSGRPPAPPATTPSRSSTGAHRPGRGGAADRARGPAPRCPGRLGADGARQQARRSPTASCTPRSCGSPARSPPTSATTPPTRTPSPTRSPSCSPASRSTAPTSPRAAPTSTRRSPSPASSVPTCRTPSPCSSRCCTTSGASPRGASSRPPGW